MELKNAGLLVALILATSVVTAGIAASMTGSGGSQAALATDQGTDDSGKQIQVSATGQTSDDPNKAIVRVAAVAKGDNATQVREQLAENVSSVRSALSELGIDSDQLRTRHYDIDQNHRRYEPRKAGDAPEEPRYRGVHALEITVSNTSQVGSVIDTAVTSGASQIDGVEFTLSEERRRTLRSTALEDAMDSARSQADTIAERANLTVTGVDYVTTGEIDRHGPRLETTAVAAAADSGTSIESGPVTVTAQVTVQYNATSR
jgi:hypothetical protein